MISWHGRDILKMLDGFGISVHVFKSFQKALERAAELVTETMVEKDDMLVDSETAEKEPLLTIGSLRILKSNPKHYHFAYHHFFFNPSALYALMFCLTGSFRVFESLYRVDRHYLDDYQMAVIREPIRVSASKSYQTLKHSF